MAFVYFAAPMENVDIDLIEEQYTIVERELEEYGHVLTNKFSLYKKELIDKQIHHFKIDSSTIVKKDIDKLRNSQIILIDFTNDNHTYIGCICEMVYAKILNKKVICIVDKTQYQNHPWIDYHCDAFYNNLNEAIKNINQLELI